MGRAAGLGWTAVLIAGLAAGLLAPGVGCGPRCRDKFEGRRYDVDRDCLTDPEEVFCTEDRSCREEAAAYLDAKGQCYFFICDPGGWEGWRKPPAGSRCNVAFLTTRNRCRGD